MRQRFVARGHVQRAQHHQRALAIGHVVGRVILRLGALRRLDRIGRGQIDQRLGLELARAARRGIHGLESVVLVDPPVSGPNRRDYPGKLPWYIDSMALARAGTDAEGMRAFCPTWTDAELQLRAEWLHTCDERAVRASYEGFHADDFHADAAQLAVPSLLITAERGDVVRDDDVAELQRATPSMRHVRVPGAGHMIPWDNAPGFYAAFGDFLGAPLAA